MNISAPLQILDHLIQPGEHRTLQLPVPEFSPGLPLHVPVRVLRGHEPGPRVFITSCLHGDEIIGVQIITRLLHSGALQRLARGDIILVPVVNIFGFVQQSRYLPDRRDLNRSFPGSVYGSLASRLAHFLMSEIVAKCTHGIDLHSGSNNRCNLPQIRVNNGNAEALRLARAFAPPLILQGESVAGTLRDTAKHIPLLLYEASEAGRFDDASAEIGWHGIVRMLEALNMLEPEQEAVHHQSATPSPVVASHSQWVRAPRTGVFEATVNLGDTLAQGQHLGTLANFFGENIHDITSPYNGVLIGNTLSPLVNEGDALFHIAIPSPPAQTTRYEL